MKNFENRIKRLEGVFLPKDRTSILVFYSNKESSVEVNFEGKIFNIPGSKDSREVQEFISQPKFKGRISTLLLYLPQKRKLDPLDKNY